MSLSEVVFKKFVSTMWNVASSRLAESDWMIRQRLETRLRESAMRAFEELEPFLMAEGLSSDRQDFLLNACLDELTPLLERPDEFFAGSLKGEKLYKRLYEQGGPPQPVVDDQLEQAFRLVFPRVADRFCAYLPLVGGMQGESTKEVLRRFDSADEKLTQLASEFREYTERPGREADTLFHQVYQSVTSEVLANLALNGLHGEREYEVRIDDIFVLPAITRPGGKTGASVEDEHGTLQAFALPGLRAVVIGQPGAGKTTWANWLQRLCLRQPGSLLALRVRLREYATKALPAYHALVRESVDAHLASRLTDSHIDRWAEAGEMMFILDGFDEVPPPRRNEFRRWLNGLSRAVPNSPVVVTTRPLSTDQIRTLPKNWLQWEMQPFDDSRVQRYIELWYRCCPFLLEDERGVNADSLMRQLQADRSLRELTGNPLMLATLLTVHHRDGQQLPRGRAQLYRRYVDGMLGVWEQRIRVKREVELTAVHKRRLLTHIALHFHLQDIDQLGETEVGGRKGMHELVDQILLDLRIRHPASEVLAELRERTGMLDGPGTYAFVHKSVGEFLFAEALKEGHLADSRGETIDRQWLFARRHEDRWRGVLYFWAGQASISDLQGFIDSVGNARSDVDTILELALLYDQMERLPKTWLAEQLAGILRSEVSTRQTILEVSAEPRYVCPQSRDLLCSFREIPIYELPTLSHVLSYEPVGSIAAHCEVSLVELSKTAAKSWLPQLWFLGLSSGTMEEWKYFASRHWSESQAADPLYILSFLLQNAGFSPNRDGNWLRDAVEWTCVEYPELQSKAALMVFADALSDTVREHGRRLVLLLKFALPAVIQYPVDPDWLANSDGFVSGIGAGRTADILLEVSGALKQAGEQQDADGGSMCELNGYVDRLIMEREVLLATITSQELPVSPECSH